MLLLSYRDWIMNLSNNYQHKIKAYIHCDFPVGLKKATEIINSDISKHRFRPFFGYNIFVEKIKKLKSEEYFSLKKEGIYQKKSKYE